MAERTWPNYAEWKAADGRPADPLWAVYARLSLDGDGDQTGVDRQIEDGLRDAEGRGATRVRIYRDDGFSAHKNRVVRPAFERLLEDLSDGEIVGLIAWRAERLARQPSDAERLLKALGADAEKAAERRAVAYTITGGVDTSTENGKFVFRQMVQFGRWESLAIGERVHRAHEAVIAKGRFTGSPPAFGHRNRSKWRELEPSEADAIRQAATWLLAGEGVLSILRRWTAAGTKTKGGKAWQHTAFLSLMKSPRLAGLREVGGSEVKADPDGKPWVAPILDLDTWRSVRTILTDPARKPMNPRRGRGPTHLLTGLMRCGLCHSPLVAKGNTGKRNGPNYWTYGCAKNPDYRPNACGRVWIKGAQTDDYIEQIVLAHLRMPAVVAALSSGLGGEPEPADDDSERKEAHELRQRLTALEAAWVRGPQALESEFSLSPEGYRAGRRTALDRLDELDRRLARNTRAKAVLRAIGDPLEFWAQADILARRDVVRAILPEISVARASSIPEFPQRWDARRIEWVAIG